MKQHTLLCYPCPDTCGGCTESCKIIKANLTPKFIQKIICYIPFNVTLDDYNTLEQKVKAFLYKNPKYLDEEIKIKFGKFLPEYIAKEYGKHKS